MANAKVEHRNVSFRQLINNDVGSDADIDLATWRPDRKFFSRSLRLFLFADATTTTKLVPEGWFYLGPAATNSSNAPGTGVVVRELEPGVLVDVADWIQVWNDAGSGTSTDFALWRGVGPTPDYVVVGGFFTRSHNKPSLEEARGIKAIHKLALRNTGPGSQIWTDKGSGADEDGAIWSISTLGVVPTGAFVPVRGYDSPPQELYGLHSRHADLGE